MDELFCLELKRMLESEDNQCAAMKQSEMVVMFKEVMRMT